MTMSPSRPSSPFYMRLYYRQGAFHPIHDSGSLPFSRPIPPHLEVYLQPDSTLEQLTFELVSCHTLPLPSPVIGTRFAFQILYQTLQNVSSGKGRYGVRELGSVVIGARGPGVEMSQADEAKVIREAALTMKESNVMPGDYISCAILPPLANGSITPAPSAQQDTQEDPLPTCRPDGRASHGRPYHRKGRDRSVRGRSDGRKRDLERRMPLGEWTRSGKAPGGSRAEGGWL